MKPKTIGILGAGKLGIVLAQLARRAGYSVNIAGSGDPAKIALTVETLAPGAKAMRASDAANNSDIIILTIPFGKLKTLQPSDFAGKIVIDAMNHWWEVDGPRQDYLRDEESSSLAVQNYLPEATVVKAFSHMSYHDLFDYARPESTVGQKAIAIAGDDGVAVSAVSELVEQVGFTSLAIGDLENGKKLEAGGPVFGLVTEADSLRKILLSDRT